MIANYVKSAVFLLLAIILFLNYNSGRGGALGSIKKRLTYLLSVLSFLAFIFFLTKGYYYNDNQYNNQIVQKLMKEYNLLESEIRLNIDTSMLEIHKQQLTVKNLIQQLDKVGNQEYDIYFNILIGILITFLGWIIGFTFRNKILG